MIAIVAGVTGATGRELMAKLSVDERFTKVVALVRNIPDTTYARAEIHKVNFDEPAIWQSKLQGDVLFLCLGTTLKQAGSKEAQYRVDFTYQYTIAKHAAENGVKTCVLISSYGADSKSSNFYLKMKGLIDENIMALGFERLCIIRPGQIHGHRDKKRATETFALKVMYFMNRMGILRRYRPITTQKLAAAMINAAMNKSPKLFVNLDEVHLLAGEVQQ